MARQTTFRQDLVDNDVILSVRHLKQFFTSGYGANKFRNKAVHDISFDIKKGEVFGLVGESGCGKTTTGRSIIRLYDVTSGSVYFKGHRINAGTRWNEKEIKWKTIKANKEIKQLRKEEANKISALRFKNQQEVENSTLELMAESVPELAFKKREVGSKNLALKKEKSLLDQAFSAYKSKVEELNNHKRTELKEKNDESQENNDAIVANINKMFSDKVRKEELTFKSKSDSHKEIISRLEKEIKALNSEISVLEKNISKGLRDQLKSDTTLLESKQNESLNEEIAAIKADYKEQISAVKADLKVIVDTQKEEIAQIKHDLKHLDKDVMSKMQMIFQDPIDSLNPRMTVEDIIQEGLQIQGQHDKAENSKKVIEALERVGLIADYASRYPHEFSGGQRQRIGIARALIMNPELIIADEPISALDVSIRAQIINLLNDLRDEYGLTILFIAHDLSVVKYFSDRIAVMYYGEIVELTTSEELFLHPLHPYTKALLSAIPKPDPLSEKKRQRVIYNPFTDHDYREEKPTLQEIRPGHFILANSAEMANYEEEIKNIDKKADKKAG